MKQVCQHTEAPGAFFYLKSLSIHMSRDSRLDHIEGMTWLKTSDSLELVPEYLL